MERQSSRRRKRAASRAFHMTDRVHVTASSGEGKSEHLRPASDRTRPQKVSATVSNPAPTSRVRMSEESVRVSRDRLVKDPPEISDTPVRGKRLEGEGAIIDGGVALAALIIIRWTPASWTVEPFNAPVPRWKDSQRKESQSRHPRDNRVRQWDE
ncbi:hypothetical protein Y032_0003g1571 [Ancylostoma ceylanicum]|uniref:Uncharacterized protein n=1 Tax=Ancylostoma ceylanicum TaxID=53326 RepID=A0A016W089_9BILA|nr:hypothetical protein Y032_0003g1571 [Ancylostoma ceylanicum]